MSSSLNLHKIGTQILPLLSGVGVVRLEVVADCLAIFVIFNTPRAGRDNWRVGFPKPCSPVESWLVMGVVLSSTDVLRVQPLLNVLELVGQKLLQSKHISRA